MTLAEKNEKLTASIKSMKRVIVAYSGGVDSTFVLKVAYDALAGTGGKVLAITATSPTYPEAELVDARKYAALIGAEHLVIDSDELEIPGFKENPPDRCFHCKTELYGKIGQIALEGGYDYILDGANADDLGDYRPGMKAARMANVRSPLIEAGLTKLEVRQLSRELGLPTHDKPAKACLASRFPYGQTITGEKLGMVDRAEIFLRELGFAQVRVRCDDKTARIELDPADIHRVADGSLRERISTELHRLGFVYITLDLDGYRTGSMNAALPESVKAGSGGPVAAADAV